MDSPHTLVNPDLAQADYFLKLLDPTAGGFTFQALDDKRLANGKPRDDAKLRQTYHGTLDQHAAQLTRLNIKFGAAIYNEVNRTDLKGRHASNITGKRAFFADLDNGLPPGGFRLPPSIIVETSPGRYQAYWLVDGDISDADYLGVLRNLTLTYGGDPGVISVERILRLPGFFHQKGEPFMVRIVEATGRRYSVAEIIAVHEPIIEQKKAEPLPAEIPETARNRTLISAAGRMRKQGFPVSAIEAALQELNRTACAPPLDEKEVTKIANSSGRYAAGKMVPEDDATAAVASHHRLALRFSERHADGARYVAAWGKWLTWAGNRWQLDETHTVRDMMREVASEEALKHDEDRIRNLIESRWTIGGIDYMAQSDKRHREAADAWDKDSWLLGTPGGTVDLRTGDLRPARREDMITKLANVSPDFSMKPLLWLRTLDQIFGGDSELIQYMQRLLGYSLTGTVSENVLAFCYGTGRNGKSTLLNTWQNVVGDYATVAPKGMLEQGKHDRHPTEIARLRGARVVIAQETTRGSRWDETTIKWLTGGDRLTGRYTHKDFFEFDPQFTLIVSGNHKPNLRDVTPAIKGRLHMIPFMRTFDGENRDPDLMVKFVAEWPGILAWAIEGCQMWRAIGLAPPRAVKDATAVYLAEQDVLDGFLMECCTQDDPDARERASDLFNRFSAWVKDRGKEPVSQKEFSTRLQSRFAHKRNETGVLFKGVRLLPQPLFFGGM
jgi:putative DNA primase/helicase